MAKVTWSHEAEAALRDIYEYISRTRPTTALRTLESILAKVESLSEAPNLGQTYPYPVPDDVHQLTYGHFRIAYRIGDGDIAILGVFHGLIFLPLR